jgi:hypothetical protein
MALSRKDAESCKSLLGQCDMFHKVPPSYLSTLAGKMELRMLKRKDEFIHQGSPTDSFFLLESGEIERKFVDPKDKKVHSVEFSIRAQSINSMRVISGEKAFCTVKCVSESCKLYEMKRTEFLKLLEAEPLLTTSIAEGLCNQLRRGSKKFVTPLLEQRQDQDVNFQAVSIAAGIESYYRSALNSILNTRLTGVKAEFFPNMHIQVPTRIAYITGFKGLRHMLDQNVDPDSYNNPTTVRLATALSPGIMMTPISSILEASNAGHMNSESMTTRWMRGIVPRAGREVVFGIGLNQLSDYFEERLSRFFDNSMAANAAGSLLAGVVSGYLSHVPHNMSTFKLLEPHRSYVDLYRMFVDKSVPPVIDNMVKTWPSSTRGYTRTLFATLFPRGLVVRTTQIVGSFMILNGTINYLQLREHNKIQRLMS